MAGIGGNPQALRPRQSIEIDIRIVRGEKVVTAGVDDVFRNGQSLGIGTVQISQGVDDFQQFLEVFGVAQTEHPFAVIVIEGQRPVFAIGLKGMFEHFGCAESINDKWHDGVDALIGNSGQPGCPSAFRHPTGNKSFNVPWLQFFLGKVHRLDQGCHHRYMSGHVGARFRTFEKQLPTMGDT
ncbi:hypothetical protein D3C78_1346100 [compost metagenome]